MTLAPCASSRCGCRTLEPTCSSTCHGPVIPGGRCGCRHEGCLPLPAHGDLYPAILDRFRPDRLLGGGFGAR